ncbi:MAG TPA: carboxypeptidase regulatory-like domain-containing protein [Bryobacteraceae bacterium]|nr:carboxypeptidase regulatory-like domain-containing protein [Bryobacteraceae bacterium]
MLKRSRGHRVSRHFTSVAIALLLGCGIASAQSTTGTVVGTVKDASGAAVPGAVVKLVNTGTNATRSTMANDSGSFEFTNLDSANYKLDITAAGFEEVQFAPFDLGARETKRVDAGLKVASQTTTVDVESTVGAALQTDTSNIAETKGSRELVDLPVAITTRAQGSTSAMSTLTAQPGVQTDPNGNISVAGTLPAQLSMSIDGISTMGPGSLNGQGGAGAIGELFPSFNAIAEIRISENINAAEFGGVSDITTISKSGTNALHGGAFENVQNNDFNAADFFSHTAPELKMNNFGIFMGGPVVFPKLYNGRDKTFFFASFEALRLPKSIPIVESVPTAAMRSGDLSVYLNAANGGAGNLLTGYPNNQIPASMINAYSQKALGFFFPLPNYGPANAVANNYLGAFNIPINSNQGDVRLDQYVGTKHQFYARYTYKNKRQFAEPYSNFGSGPPVTVNQGANAIPEVDQALTVAWNYTITPTLINELRVGYSSNHEASTFGITAQESASALGLTDLPNAPPAGVDNVPNIAIAGFVPTWGQSSIANQSTKQILETLTKTSGRHTLKFGADYRALVFYGTDAFFNILQGGYNFNGSVMSQLLGPGAATPFASFLLGYPDNATVAHVTAPNVDAMAKHYATFAQDDWKVTKNLTLNYGLRWEYHPMFRDRYNNLANFDPNYTSVVNGQTVQGAVILPGQGTYSIVDPGFAKSIYPTPIILASQDGVPGALRFSSLRDFAPRAGFAWRVFGDDKTVLRGGYGKFIEALMGSAAISAWAVQAADVGFFNNSIGANGTPTYTLPYAWPANLASTGSISFYQATNIHYQDPYVQEWNLTLERDLGYGVGLRVSYDGNHASNLGMHTNYNQPEPNTIGYSNLPASALPLPLWQYMAYNTNLGFSNYNAATVAVKKRFSKGLQFQSSYIFTRNLSNVDGAATGSADAYAGEFGGFISDQHTPGLDYGNVAYSRRNRFLTTFLYELPFGKGQTFLNSANGFVDRIVNGWELSGVLLFQSGPFMSVATLDDPCGCGYNVFNATGGRADTVSGVSPYAGQSINQWINPAAFTNPGNAIGRFGDASAGDVVGPGTQAVSLSLIKSISLTEQIRIRVGAQVGNVFNHPNFAVPGSLIVGVAGFGQITSLQSAEGAGPRDIQLTARINF